MDGDGVNTTGIYGSNRVAPYEMGRGDRLDFLRTTMRFPTSYIKLTEKESLVLDYVNTFRSQFSALYPTRAPLLLTPHNECNTPKFISTFLRPTQLPYKELYDCASCAKYIANYIKYEALDGDCLPQTVLTPATVLQCQVGNSVEMSLLLCSALLGSGYSACVAIGSAVKVVCDNDQSMVPWPENLPKEVCSDDEESEVTFPVTAYTDKLKSRPKLVSRYDAAKRQQDIDDMVINYEEENNDGVEEEGVATQIHSWVIVMPGKRKVEKAFFVEPSTGQIIEIADADVSYKGIDSVFNHHNYFVNMSPETPVSQVSLEMRDLSVWEHVFINDPEANAEEGSEAVERNKAHESHTSDRGESGDLILDVPTTFVHPLTLNRAQYENRYPGRTKAVEYADATVSLFANYTQNDCRVMTVETIDHDTNYKHLHTFYRNREDHLRRRSTVQERDLILKTSYWFNPGRRREGRVEGLRELIVEPGKHRTMKFFWKAREDGLCRRVERFFGPDTNGNPSSDEHPCKIKEVYKGREEDHLVYRSATFEPLAEQSITTGLQHTRPEAGDHSRESHRLPIKMTEKFSRNPNKEADEDVQKRAYIKPTIPEGEVWVYYHYRSDSITRPMRLFPKNAEREKDSAVMTNRDVVPEVITMPFAEPPKSNELVDELRALIVREKECLIEIRAKTDEGRELLQRSPHHQPEKDKEVPRVIKAYDTIRQRPMVTEAELALARAEESRRAEARRDYLAPYIAKIDAAKPYKGDYSKIRLSKDHAQQVKNDALRDLKERLIQRGHIMQSRMDREREELNRQQMTRQKNLDSNEGTKESEEFARFCTEAAWRMKILDERLSRHIEQASEKYAALVEKLAKDQRLAALYES